MNIDFINQIFYPFFCFAVLTSILGYGTILNKYNNINDVFFNLKNLIFIQGLILISLFSIIINFFIPISNYLTILIILIGSVIYLNYFVKLKDKKKEIIFISFVVILSFIFSFYAGVNDDFVYHYETIKNFKNKSIFEISHHRMISYNSNWLFLNSIITIDYLTSTIFILASLMYAILIYDTHNLYLKNLKKYNFFVGILSFFILIFFLGVLNKYKDFGTDIPGVIILSYILIIIIYFIFDKKIKYTNNIFFLLLLLISFSFVIKITNSLILIYFLLIIFYFNFRLINLKHIFFSSLLPLLWIIQNYNISGCLIWPIEFTCFKNNDLAINEYYLIESFAKGDIATSIKVNGFDWINTWLVNHSKKLIETYLVFSLIIFLPILYFLITNKKIRGYFLNDYLNTLKNLNFIILILIVIISNLIWFLYAPAYRFGLFYNFSLIIFLALPLWLTLLRNNYKFIYKYCRIITLIVFIYIIITNISKFNWYLERFEIWPPIKDNELISRKIS